jgi:glycosyltransferase involved in cell wall biosynthesis
MTEPATQKISVILCFYNEEKFLSEAVESVFSQTYPDWELILVDDGSTDGSSGVAKSYVARFPDKIRYVEHEQHSNKGLSASRNAGIKMTQGSFVAFIDADDVWLSDKLYLQLDIFKRYPETTVLLEASLYWYSWSNNAAHDVPIAVGVEEGLYYPPALIRQLYPLGKGAAPCPSGIMVRRAVLDRCIFEESFRGMYQMYEDQAFLCKVYLKENVFVSSVWNNKYRQRPSSLVSSVYESGKYDTVRNYYLNWFEGYAKSTGLHHAEVTPLLKKALLPYRQPLLYKFKVAYPETLKLLTARMLMKLGVIKDRKE